MKTAHPLRWLAGLLTGFSLVHAQTSPATDSTTETVVNLPAFSVSSQKDDSYTGRQALSATRIGVDLADVPQSIVVLNQKFVMDQAPSILANTLLYVGGAQTGTISWSVDRNIIRGFVGEGDYVDGFRTQTDRNTDMNVIDHVEVIKGPSSIFVSNTANTIGGVVSKISKSPTSYRVGTLSMQFGRWDANRADLDVGGPITADKKFMYRLLLSGQDSRGYADHTYEKRTAIVPMVAYQFSPDSQVWLKFENFDSHYSSYNGLPLDGRTNQMLAVPYTTNLAEDTPNNWRTDWYWKVWGQLTSRLNDHVALRLAAFDSADYQRRVESILAVQQGGGTGPATAPVLTPNYAISPTFTNGSLAARGTTAINPDYQPRREVQHDYVLNFETGPISHKTLLGADLIDYPETIKAYSSGGTSTATSSAINPFNPAFPGTVTVNFNQPPTAVTDLDQSFAKIFVLENASLLKNRLVLNFGASRSRFETGRTVTPYNQLTGVTSAPAISPHQTLYKNLVQYGVVVKPLTNVSVFYGFNQNFASNGFDQNGKLFAPQSGEQKELGVKTTWLEERLSVSLNYFNLAQANNVVNAFPQTTPPSNILVAGEVSRGFDGDFSFKLTKNLDVTGSYATFKAHVPLPAPYNLVRQPYDNLVHTDLPVNNVSQNNLSAWTRYRLPGNLKGFSVGVGINHLDKRAITDNANQQFYGYLPARTLVDAMLQYETKQVRYQLNVDNLLDKKYIYASRNNQILVPGTPLNLRATIAYKFW